MVAVTHLEKGDLDKQQGTTIQSLIPDEQYISFTSDPREYGNCFCEHKPMSSTSPGNLRSRITWMYYIEELTQNQIAEQLGIGRISVQRMLVEAKKRNEISITVKSDVTDSIELERRVENEFDLRRAIVVPLSSKKADPAPVIGAALGTYISDLVTDGMSVGAGWGRTLRESINYTTGRTLKDFKVISMLGGIIQARRFNPAEFAWQFAERFQGEGFLIPAPAIVDSETTRNALIDHCGLDSIFDMARNVDVALLSVGGADPSSTAYRVGYLSDAESKSLTTCGAVGDLLFHFYDIDGKVVDHEINDRIVSVDLDTLKNIPTRILASGGQNKLQAVFGALTLLKPEVLITDEYTAQGIIALIHKR